MCGKWKIPEFTRELLENYKKEPIFAHDLHEFDDSKYIIYKREVVENVI